MAKNSFIRLICMLVLFVPIGLGAAWGVFHSRPDFYWLKRFTKNGESYLLGKHYLKNNPVLTCLNTDTEEFKSICLPRQREIERGYSYSGFDGHDFWNIESDLLGQNPLCVVSVPDLSIIAKSTFEESTFEDWLDPQEVCVVGSYLVRIQADFVSVESIKTQLQTDSMRLRFAVSGLLYQILGTQNVLVYERTKGNRNPCDFTLLRIDSGKIKQIASWKALYHRVLDRTSPQTIVSLLPDGTTIKTIDAIDGKAYCSKALPGDFNLPLPLSSMYGDFNLNWLQFSRQDSGGMNVLTGEALKVPNEFQGIWHDVNRHRLLCRRPFSQNDSELVVFDLKSERILFRFQLPVNYYQVEDMQIIGDQLFLASRDGRVFFYNLSSGTLLQTIDPFRFVHWINCICGVAFLLWCVLWSNFSKETHLTGLIDLFVYSMPVLAYVIMVYTHGHNQGRSDATAVSAGIMLGLSVLASIWFAIGRPRWSMGILPVILCVLMSLAIHSYTVGDAGMYNRILIWAILCTAITASCFILILRSSSIQFCFDYPASFRTRQIPTEQKSNVFPLRDLFLWTACFGIFFAMLKNNLCTVWMDWSVLLIAIPLGFFIAVIGTAAMFLAMYCTDLIANRVAKLSCALTVLGAFLADPAGTMVLPFGATVVFENLRFPFYLMPVWLTVYLGLYAFRLRGWRIRFLIPDTRASLNVPGTRLTPQ